MKIQYDCLPCLAREAVKIAKDITNDDEKQEKIIKHSLKVLSTLTFDRTAPMIAYQMHQYAKEITGIQDPYKDLKNKFNTIANTIVNKIIDEQWIEQSKDPFDLACRLSIAGNIIDFSVGLTLDNAAVVKSVEKSLKQDLFGAGSKALKSAVESSENILFLADNAGEIVFDRLLLQQLPHEKVIVAVKGGPIVNDATMLDAKEAKIDQLVTVIDNGHDAQGTTLDYCSKEFNEIFNQADLIISKGQANYETLSHLKNKNIFYLLRAKCDCIAESIGCNTMDYVLSNV